MRQCRLSGYLFDIDGGVYRAGGDRLKPTESDEFANTFRPQSTPAGFLALASA